MELQFLRNVLKGGHNHFSVTPMTFEVIGGHRSKLGILYIGSLTFRYKNVYASF